jgi:hypothetical protein
MQPALQTHTLEAEIAELLSCRRFSPTWYQYRWSFIFGVAFVTTLAGYLSYVLFGLTPPLALIVLAVVVFVTGSILDRVTTHRVSSLKPQYDAKNLAFEFTESNPYLPSHPTLRDMIWGVPTILEAFAFIATCFLPLACLSLGVGMLLVSASNHRLLGQARYQLELFDLMTTNKEIPASEYLYAIPTVTG